MYSAAFAYGRAVCLKAKVLIIDDSAVSTQFFTDILEQEDYSVIVSHDGKDVIDLIQTHDIDIVLLDIIMPEITGYEILETLQETDAARDIPVIMITQLTSPFEVKKALDLGAMDFIRKTSEPIEVIARIRSALRLKQKQDLLKQNAMLDHLTQLYNKQFFNMALEKVIREKDSYYKGIGLVLMDCDYFKRINDSYGHVSGDMVLATVANAIHKSVKMGDLACRFGGEEFCVILPNVTPFQAYMVAERIRTNVEKIPFIFQEKTVSVTVSCGVSHLERDDDKSGLKLVNESDAALYRAKHNGRNKTVLFSEDDTEG